MSTRLLKAIKGVVWGMILGFYQAGASDLPSEDQLVTEILKVLPAGSHYGQTLGGELCEIDVRTADGNGYFEIAAITTRPNAGNFAFVPGSAVTSFNLGSGYIQAKLKQPSKADRSPGGESLIELQIKDGKATSLKVWQTNSTLPGVTCVFDDDI